MPIDDIKDGLARLEGHRGRGVGVDWRKIYLAYVKKAGGWDFDNSAVDFKAYVRKYYPHLASIPITITEFCDWELNEFGMLMINGTFIFDVPKPPGDYT